MKIVERTPGPDSLLFLVLSPFLAALVGAGIGALCARFIPEEKWASLSWWLAAAAYMVVEVVFEAIVEIFGAYSKQARVLVAVSTLLGFYAAWFLVK